uniref:DNA 5'-3' helicase n=1 Tax=Polysiphonia sp. TaxID=1967842 RepID=A0A1Z1MTY0_9FLOR|nr:Replication helicase subunit [Polysiphonia sp.]
MNQLCKNQFIPKNKTVEETLLGIIILYPQTIKTLSKILKREHFFLESSQIIYLNINNSFTNNTINLLFSLQNKRLLCKIGGTEIIIKMMKKGQVFLSSSKFDNQIEYLVNVLHNNYTKRLIIQLGYNIVQMGHIIEAKHQTLYLKILSYTHLIDKQINKNNQIINIKDLISKKLLEIKYNKIYTSEKLNTIEIKSGFSELDKILISLPKGNLIIIAGRPSIGKTSFAINVAYNIFFYQNSNILIFSMEMSTSELLNKLISIASKMDINTPIIQALSEKQWKKISNICNQLLKSNIYINDRKRVNINYISELGNRTKKKNYINLIIIDYLQLIELSAESQQQYNRSQELGYITRKLKLIAQFLNLPVIVISQLNRNIETRINKEPLLSDLKESGCIKYQDNINITSVYTTCINIKNVNKRLKIQNLTNTNKLSNIKNQKKTTSSHIYLSNKFIFIYKNKNTVYNLTYNHKYLCESNWIESSKILLSTTINKSNKNNKVYKKNINTIFYYKYSKSYDINQNTYFNVISQDTITHNSIEQDADIVINLYEKEMLQSNTKVIYEKTMNLKVSKNRNGYTGYCKLLFVPATSTFKNLEKSSM